MTNRVEDAQIANEVNDANLDVMEAFAEMANDMESIAQKQRDPEIPEGTELGEGNIDGMQVKWKKQSSMHHMNGKPLPDRVPMYRWPTNEVSMIPTSRVVNRLQRVDPDGHKSWSLNEPFPDGQEPEWIYKDVPNINGTTSQKKFRDEAAYEAFMRNKHPDVWTAMLRQEERSERQADRQEQRALARAMLMNQGGKTGGGFPLFMLDELGAPALRKLAKEFNIELTDKRSIENMKAEIKAGLGYTE